MFVAGFWNVAQKQQKSHLRHKVEGGPAMFLNKLEIELGNNC